MTEILRIRGLYAPHRLDSDVGVRYIIPWINSYVYTTEIHLADCNTTPFHLNRLTWIGGGITLENCFSSAYINRKYVFIISLWSCIVYDIEKKLPRTKKIWVDWGAAQSSVVVELFS